MVAYMRLLWAGPLTGVAAAAINAVVYLVASGLGAIPEDFVVGGSRPVTLEALVFTSILSALVAAVLFTLFARFTRRPVRNFHAVVMIVLVLSFATPFALPGAPLAIAATLLLMHVMAAVVIISVLTVLSRTRWRRFSWTRLRAAVVSGAILGLQRR